MVRSMGRGTRYKGLWPFERRECGKAERPSLWGRPPEHFPQLDCSGKARALGDGGG